MVDPIAEADFHELIELFYFGYRSFTARPDRVLERRGLSRVHHRILYFVARRPALARNTHFVNGAFEQPGCHGLDPNRSFSLDFG